MLVTVYFVYVYFQMYGTDGIPKTNNSEQSSNEINNNNVNNDNNNNNAPAVAKDNENNVNNNNQNSDYKNKLPIQHIQSGETRIVRKRRIRRHFHVI